MAQSTDLVVPNTSAAGVRSAINTRLLAIATHQSGATAPATTYAYQFWADTTAGLLKQRDGANSSWITIGTLGTANLGLAALASPTFTGTPAGPTAAAGTNTTQLATTAFVATAVANASPVLGTVKNSNTGSSVDFTSIPSWAKRVSMIFNGVSTNGSATPRLQLGTSSGLTTTGYVSTGSVIAGSVSTANSSSGFVINSASGGHTLSGTVQLVNISGNTWIASGALGTVDGTVATFVVAGTVALSAVLDRLSLITTDTFDAGTINILYE